MKVATSLIQGKPASPALAAEATQLAMQKAGITSANCVLLLLTTEFTNHLQAAIRAVASAAQCTQVIGCSATGIFTEEDWVLDCPAVAVMVFGDAVHLALGDTNPSYQPLLTLSAPNAINSAWLNNGAIRYGGVSGDATGQGAFTVWQNAKGAIAGHAEAYFSNVTMGSRASHGLKILSNAKKIHTVDGFDLIQLNHTSALQDLNNAWNQHLSQSDTIVNKQVTDAPIPQHLIMAIYAIDEASILKGEYAQTTLISIDEATGRVTLAQPLAIGQYISWALRDESSTQSDLINTTNLLLNDLNATPDFGLMFSNISRGPFNDGIDHDLNTITQMLPNMPLLGFYGNGTIATIDHQNHLLPYSVVLSLFVAD